MRKCARVRVVVPPVVAQGPSCWVHVAMECTGEANGVSEVLTGVTMEVGAGVLASGLELSLAFTIDDEIPERLLEFCGKVLHHAGEAVQVGDLVNGASVPVSFRNEVIMQICDAVH